MTEYKKPEPKTHIMLDIETMGNTSNSAITSIGAVEFNLDTGEIGNKFYTKVDLKSCTDLGLVINPDTVLWWLKQNEQARLEIADRSTQPPHLVEALHKFTEFIKLCGGKDNCLIWGNSARFDCGIMADAYNKINVRIPWDFRNERCVRTLVSFKPSIKENMPFTGVLHNALDDCIHQIKYCVATFNSIKQSAFA